jgi:hypothetical protein
MSSSSAAPASIGSRPFGNGMTPLELALLATRLRGIDPPTRLDGRGYHVQLEPRFELRAKERRELAHRLIAAGHGDNVAARHQTGVSRTTWWRIRQDLEQADHGGLTPHIEASPDAGLRVSKRAPAGSRPILHFDATSGASACDPIRELLGAAA